MLKDACYLRDVFFHLTVFYFFQLQAKTVFNIHFYKILSSKFFFSLSLQDGMQSNISCTCTIILNVFCCHDIMLAFKIHAVLFSTNNKWLICSILFHHYNETFFLYFRDILSLSPSFCLQHSIEGVNNIFEVPNSAMDK